MESAEAILIADAEGDDDGEAAAVAARIAAGFKAAGAADARIAETIGERERLWALRHAASPILSQLSETLKSMQVIEDGCVPPPRLGEYVAGLRAGDKIADDAGEWTEVLFVLYGAMLHMDGDGAIVAVTDAESVLAEYVQRLKDQRMALPAHLPVGGRMAYRALE